MEQSDTRSSSSGQSSREGAYSGKQDPGDVAQGVRDKALDSMEEMAGQVRRQAADAAEKQKRTAADQTRGFADALRRSAEQLDRQHQSFLARCVASCAANLDSMSDTLRDKDVNTLLGQTQNFARRQPGIFLGGAVTTGFLIARFLKSSDERRHADSGRSASSSPRSESDSPHREEPAPVPESPPMRSNASVTDQSPASEVDPHAR